MKFWLAILSCCLLGGCATPGSRLRPTPARQAQSLAMVATPQVPQVIAPPQVLYQYGAFFFTAPFTNANWVLLQSLDLIHWRQADYGFDYTLDEEGHIIPWVTNSLMHYRLEGY